MIERIKWRQVIAEALGTGCLVFFAVGVATLSFGFRLTGFSVSAGVVATALAFGLVLLVLVYGLGPISGCHVNPAVTLGFLLARRVSVFDAVSYWVAQLVGAIVGAGILYGLFHTSPEYSTKSVGLGTNGYGDNSIIHASALGALITEVVLTFLFVFVILAVTRRASNALVAGVVIGLALTIVHLVGIPIDGTSVNPARSIGPALYVGGSALSQLWVFIIGPLVGGTFAALLAGYLYPEGEEEATIEPAPEEQAP